jgi:hypothetical protein
MTLLGLALALAFGAVTWYALESSDVAILRTRGGDGALLETHVWPAEDAGVVWLEAATPERSWLRHVEANPEIELVHGGAARRYRALPDPGPEGHARIRRLLRAKYGWRDWWVGLLQDTSRSVAVKLVASGSAAHGHGIAPAHARPDGPGGPPKKALRLLKSESPIAPFASASASGS